MATIKVSSKVSKSTKETSKAKAEKVVIKLIAVPSQVQTMVQSMATAAYQADVAIGGREKSIINLGLLVGNTMGNSPRDVTKASIAPLIARALREANEKLGKDHPKHRDDKALTLYIGQQLSRIVSVAYPGGKDASAKEREKATQDTKRALAENRPQPEILKFASGGLKFQGNKVVEVENHTRGAANKIAPLDKVRRSLKSLMSEAKTAGIKKEQFMLALYDQGIDLKWWSDDEEMKALC